MAQTPAQQHSCNLKVFPGEVWDRTLDFLHDDYDALANCTLVCRHWLNTARFHLFESLSITPRTGPVSDLTTFLVESEPIAHCVKIIRIMGYNDLTVRSLACLLWAVKDRLPKLDLVVRNVEVMPSELSPDVLDLLHREFQSPRFPAILSITLWDWWMVCESPDQFPILGLFDRIDMFELKYTRQRSDPLDVAPGMLGDRPVAAGPEVNEFIARHCRISPLAPIIERSFRISLTTIHLDSCIFTWDDVKAIGKVLPLCTNLDLLRILLLPMGTERPFVESEDASWRDLDLYHCERLRILYLEVVIGTVDFRHRGAAEIFEANVAIIRSCRPSLSDVLLEVKPMSRSFAVDPAELVPTDLGKFRWDALDAVLSEGFDDVFLFYDCYVVPGKCQLVVLDREEVPAEVPLLEAYEARFKELLPRYLKRSHAAFKVMRAGVVYDLATARKPGGPMTLASTRWTKAEDISAENVDVYHEVNTPGVRL